MEHWTTKLSQDIWDIYRDFAAGKLYLHRHTIDNAVELCHAMTQQLSPKAKDGHVPFVILDEELRIVVIWYDKKDKSTYQIISSPDKANKFTWINESKSSKVSELYVEDLDRTVIRYLCYVLDREDS